MTDQEFLTWLQDRLIHVYQEGKNVDFVQRFGKIIDEHFGGRSWDIQHPKTVAYLLSNAEQQPRTPYAILHRPVQSLAQERGESATTNRGCDMAKTFPTCGLQIYNGEIRLWIGDTEGAESVLTDDQIDAFIRNLKTIKQKRGTGRNITWVNLTHTMDLYDLSIWPVSKTFGELKEE